MAKQTSVILKTFGFMDLVRSHAEYQDSLPQPPFLTDPEDALQDEAGFRAWRQGKDGNLLTLLETWFRERTGIIVCAVFPAGFAYRPKYRRNERGVWHSWGKLPKWFKRLAAKDGK